MAEVIFCEKHKVRHLADVTCSRCVRDEEMKKQKALAHAERMKLQDPVKRLEKAQVIVSQVSDFHGTTEEVAIEKNLWECTGCGLVWEMRKDAEACKGRGHRPSYSKWYGVKYYENGRPVGGYEIVISAIRRETVSGVES